MKKIILLSLVIGLSSCTIPGMDKKDESFSSLYKENIHSSVKSFEELGTALGVNRHESIEGVINSALAVPGLFSGSLTSKYTGIIDGRNSESVFQNLHLLFASLISSGSLSADEVSLLSHGTDSYLSYKNITDVGIIPDPVKDIIRKYENTWLNISQSSIENMSADELMGYNIGKNIFTKSLADLEKYAVDYAVIKDTKDLGMSGALHFWSVELDRSNIVNLAKQLTKDLAGTGMTDENVKAMTTSLESISFSGKLGFDPKDPKISLLEGILSSSGKIIADIKVSHDKNNSSIQITNSEEKTVMSLSYGKTDNKYVLDGKITKDNVEMGKIAAYIEQKDGQFRELSIEASAQGMVISLKHTLDGNKFTGKISAVVATLEWSGITNDGHLEELKVNGTSPVGTVSAELTKGADKMIRGPIIVKNGENILASANVGLEIAREKFAIVIDLLSKEMPAHFDFSVTAKSTPSTKQVVLPTNTKSFQEMIKEIDALTTAVAPIPENIESTSPGVDSMMNTESPAGTQSLLNTNTVSPQ